jgi:Gpi18-like mannosyltransferase
MADLEQKATEPAEVTEAHLQHSPEHWRDWLPPFIRRLDWKVIGTILSIKALFYLYGTEAYQVLKDSSIGGFKNWLALWNRWDAVHYVALAQNGYQATGEARFLIVFYPLFPWLTRIAALIFRNYVLSALIVVGIASIVAGLLLQQLVRLDYDREVAERAVWFLFIFPGSAALHTPFTESVLLALAIGSFLAARKERWLLAGLLGALACLSRINGLVLMPALLVEAGHQYWITRRWRWQWLWVGIVGLGVGGYLLLNYHVHGNPFMFMTYRREHWFQIMGWPWIGMREKFLMAWHGTGEGGVVTGVQDLLFLTIGLIATVWSFVKLRPSYAIWMAGNWLLFTSTTFIIGVARFTVIMFPLFIIFSILSNHQLWRRILTVWSLLFLALFTGLFVEGHWVF